MNEFARTEEALIQAQLAACERTIRSGWYILGGEVAAFESEWASRCGVAHAVGVGNGMDALELILRALGIGGGDEVVTTPMTAFATALAILRAGAQPVFADVDPATAILDPASVERCVSERTRAVLLVHLYGQAGPLDRFVSLCSSRGLHLIEDCAQSHGATWNGKPTGSHGIAAGWSFYPTKNLGACGDAGAVTTSSQEIAETIRCLRNYGQTDRYHHDRQGLNSRLDELQAAILRARLKYLDAWITRRRHIARAYYDGIRNPLVEPMGRPATPDTHVHHLFVVTCDDRDSLSTHLRASSVESLCHYPIPVHLQPPCRHARVVEGGVPRAELHARTCLSLPCHPAMTDEEVGAVIDAVNAYRG